MNTFRAGLLAWGLLVAAAGGTLIYSATIQALTAFQVILTALAATGVVLAIAAVIPRREVAETTDPDSSSFGATSQNPETLD